MKNEDEPVEGKSETDLVVESDVILLDNLNKETDLETWNKFFTQRGAEEFWLDDLQQEDKSSMRFSLSFLGFPSIDIQIEDQVNQVVAGIIRYLVCHQIHITEIAFEGSYLSKKLTVLPVEICNLLDLEYLDLSDNNLTELPVELSKLIKLKWLILPSNQITQIPRELGKLTELKKLDLSGNQLKKLPSSIIPLLNSIIKEGYIDLQKNPWIQLRQLQLIDLDNDALKVFVKEHILTKSKEPQVTSNLNNLINLAMWYIQTNSDKFEEVDFSILPSDISLDSPKFNFISNLLDNIVFFKKINNGNIPFYLDRLFDANRIITELLEEGMQLYEYKA